VTGLSHPIRGDLRAGDHVCCAYEGADEKRAVVVDFVRQGLGRGERCLYIGSPAEHAELLAAMEASGERTAALLERGALVLASTAETYLRTGTFDPEDTLALLDSLIEAALAAGFSGLRASGEPAGTMSDDLWRQVRWYEAQLSERFARRPFVGLCRYHTDSVAPERVQDLLRTHPLMVVRGELCGNPFYERAELAVSDDARARADWQLHQVRALHRSQQPRRRPSVTPRSGADGTPSRDDSATPPIGRAASELRRSVRIRDHLLTALADDLGDPLTALNRELEALRGHPDVTPPPERVAAANLHLRRLSTAVERARDVARLLDGDVTVAGDACDLADLLRDIAARYRDTALAAGCALRVRAPERAPGVWDRRAIEQIAAALLGNAIVRGAGRPVEILLEVGAEHATLVFQDVGPPLLSHGASGEPDPTGEPTAQDAASARSGGVSIWIAHQLIAAQGGRLSAADDPAGGVAYTVELPVTRLRPRG
jgi:signal transduction histidine kinase